MALDRQSIEKRDFPLSAHGYDPDAVQAHLARVATEVEQLRASGSGRGETLAASASEQVRAILEAAENSAAEIQRQATAQARDYLDRVTESAQVIRQRLRSMESELSALLEGQSLPRPTATEPEGPVASATPPEPHEPEPPPPPPAALGPEPTPGGADLAGGFRATGSVGDSRPRNAGDDTEGARLIAFNMAQNGTPREEADRYLSENFALNDRASLLDEVYSSVGADPDLRA